MTALGNYVRRRREALKSSHTGFSLRSLASRIGIHHSYLSKLERGEYAPLSPLKIEALARELSVEADLLFALSGRLSDRLIRLIATNPEGFVDALHRIELEMLPKNGKNHKTRKLEQRQLELEELTRRLRDEMRLRQKQQEALAQQESELLLILNSLDNASIIYVDKEYTLLWANSVALCLHDTTFERSLGKKCYSAFHAMSKPCMMCKIDFSPDKSKENVKHVESSNGKHWLSKCVAIPGKSGNSEKYVLFQFDITDLIATKTDLIHSEQRWQFALEGGLAGVWDWNNLTNKVYYSPRWKEILGFSDLEVGDGLDEWSSRIHPDDSATVWAVLNKHLDGELEHYESEHRLLCKDGSYKWILDRGMVISRDSDGLPLRAIGTHTDISRRKAIEIEPQEIAENYIDLFNKANDAVLIVDTKTMQFVMANPAACNMLGYSSNEMLQMGPKDIDAKPCEASANIEIDQYYPNGRVFEVKHMTKDGRYVPVELSVRPITFKGRSSMLAIARDISQRKNLELELQNSLKQFRVVANFTYDWEYWRAPDGSLVWVSPACERVSGYTAEEFMAEPGLLSSIVIKEDMSTYENHIAQVEANANDHVELELRIVHRTGQIIWISHRCQSIWSEDGILLGRRACNRDISATKRLVEELEQQASTDTLTGVFNRRHILEQAEQEFIKSKRYGLPLSLLVIDVDSFKRINDSCGHSAGDDALRLLTHVCKSELRTSDSLGRIGGDEFVVLLPHTHHEDALLIADRLRICIEEATSVSLSGKFTVSIGISSIGHDVETLAMLLRCADSALYEAKSTGRNCVRICKVCAFVNDRDEGL